MCFDRFIKKKTVPHPLADDAMLSLFLSMIDVRINLIELTIRDDEINRKRIFDEVRSGLSNFYDKYNKKSASLINDAWNEAYRLERLVALIEPAENLPTEVRRRLAEAASDKCPATARLQARFDALAPDIFDTTSSPPALKPGGEATLREMLLDILEEIHWDRQRVYHARPIQKSAARRLVAVGLVACILFMSPYIFIYVRESLGHPLPFERWAGLPLWTAVTAGFFGAMFSRLLYLQSNWKGSLGVLKEARDFNSIILRGCVGMCGAIVVYFVLLSGIFSGELFPNFEEIGLHQLWFPIKKEPTGAPVQPVVSQPVVSLRIIVPNPELAALAVWSFLAGFSERLVPSVLEKTEGALASQSPK